MAQATSPAIPPNGSKTRALIMFVVRRCILRPKARSSDGIRPSRTASCLRTTICQAISKPGSASSSLTTIICDTTRVSPTSPRPTSTSDAARPSCLNEKGSNDRPSRTDACFTAARPLNITQQMRQILHSISPPIVPNVLTTDIKQLLSGLAHRLVDFEAELELELVK